MTPAAPCRCRCSPAGSNLKAAARRYDSGSRLRAGQVAVNHVGGNSDTPFGGYKQSGNGREKGRFGLAEYLELKAITGALAD